MQHSGFIALAGIAEQAYAFELLIGFIALVLVGIAVCIAFWRQSWVAAIVATVLVGLVTLLFMPWWAFMQLSAEDAQDPDVVEWTGNYRVFGVAWIVAVLAAVASLVVVKMRRSRRAE